MRSSSRSAGRGTLWVACLLVFPVFAQTPADEKPAGIEGEVRDSITLAPIERAHVGVRRFTNGALERYGVLTNAEGKFLIPNIPAGSYSLVADRIGYVDLNASQASQMTFAAGQKRDNIKLKLVPTGTIVGRVLDANGDPMEGLTVAAESGGREQRSGSTDDRGAFRIGGLAPGKYRVRAKLQTIPLPPEIRTDGTAEVHYSPTYYPSALDPKNASRVEVQAAADATGVEIRLARTPIVRLSGKVSGAPAGAQNVSVMLTLANGSGANGAQVRPDGTFELWRADPGKYTARAQYYGSGDFWRSAPLEIEVGENDLENLALQIAPPVDIKGATVFEDEDARKPPGPGGTPPPSANARQQQQQQQPQKPQPRYVLVRETSGMNIGSGQLDDDGAFTLQRMAPGKYFLAMNTGRTYIKSIDFGQVHSDGSQIDMRSGANAPLTIHVASSTATVSGLVRDDKGPVGGARVALVDTRYDRPMPSFAQSKEDGSYTFQAVAPGKYRILALDEADMSLITAGNQEDLEDAAETIEVPDRGTVTKDLKRRALPGTK